MNAAFVYFATKNYIFSTCGIWLYSFTGDELVPLTHLAKNHINFGFYHYFSFSSFLLVIPVSWEVAKPHISAPFPLPILRNPIPMTPSPIPPNPFLLWLDLYSLPYPQAMAKKNPQRNKPALTHLSNRYNLFNVYTLWTYFHCVPKIMEWVPLYDIPVSY